MHPGILKPPESLEVGEELGQRALRESRPRKTKPVLSRVADSMKGVLNSTESSTAQSKEPVEIRPPPPFPQRLKKQKQDYQFKKFLDILKQVHINLPLVEALQQMLNYANINLELGVGEAKPTTVMLQLANHSYVQPKGKIEDILVQVDKFILPADFLILDCEADEYAPIILGRPFLSTSRAVIDFDDDEITFKVENNNIKMKTKELPRAKLYMGAHVERDMAAMYQNKWRAQKKERKKPKASAQ
ncbi:hypothetical protein GQ457_11G025900 [Hibiscus cannabinus]